MLTLNGLKYSKHPYKKQTYTVIGKNKGGDGAVYSDKVLPPKK
jgi:hypothetical protein